MAISAKENLRRKIKSGIEEIKNPRTITGRALVRVGRQSKKGIKELKSPISPVGKRIKGVRKAISRTLAGVGVKSIKQAKMKLEQLRKKKLKKR